MGNSIALIEKRREWKKEEPNKPKQPQPSPTPSKAISLDWVLDEIPSFIKHFPNYESTVYSPRRTTGDLYRELVKNAEEVVKDMKTKVITVIHEPKIDDNKIREDDIIKDLIKTYKSMIEIQIDYICSTMGSVLDKDMFNEFTCDVKGFCSIFENSASTLNDIDKEFIDLYFRSYGLIYNVDEDRAEEFEKTICENMNILREAIVDKFNIIVIPTIEDKSSDLKTRLTDAIGEYESAVIEYKNSIPPQLVIDDSITEAKTLTEYIGQMKIANNKRDSINSIVNKDKTKSNLMDLIDNIIECISECNSLNDDIIELECCSKEIENEITKAKNATTALNNYKSYIDTMNSNIKVLNGYIERVDDINNDTNTPNECPKIQPTKSFERCKYYKCQIVDYLSTIDSNCKNITEVLNESGLSDDDRKPLEDFCEELICLNECCTTFDTDVNTFTEDITTKVTTLDDYKSKMETLVSNYESLITDLTNGGEIDEKSIESKYNDYNTEYNSYVTRDGEITKVENEISTSMVCFDSRFTDMTTEVSNLDDDYRNVLLNIFNGYNEILQGYINDYNTWKSKLDKYEQMKVDDNKSENHFTTYETRKAKITEKWNSFEETRSKEFPSKMDIGNCGLDNSDDSNFHKLCFNATSFEGYSIETNLLSKIEDYKSYYNNGVEAYNAISECYSSLISCYNEYESMVNDLNTRNTRFKWAEYDETYYRYNDLYDSHVDDISRYDSTYNDRNTEYNTNESDYKNFIKTPTYAVCTFEGEDCLTNEKAKKSWIDTFDYVTDIKTRAESIDSKLHNLKSLLNDYESKKEAYDKNHEDNMSELQSLNEYYVELDNDDSIPDELRFTFVSSATTFNALVDAFSKLRDFNNSKPFDESKEIDELNKNSTSVAESRVEAYGLQCSIDNDADSCACTRLRNYITNLYHITRKCIDDMSSTLETELVSLKNECDENVRKYKNYMLSCIFSWYFVDKSDHPIILFTFDDKNRRSTKEYYLADDSYEYLSVSDDRNAIIIRDGKNNEVSIDDYDSYVFYEAFCDELIDGEVSIRKVYLFASKSEYDKFDCQGSKLYKNEMKSTITISTDYSKTFRNYDSLSKAYERFITSKISKVLNDHVNEIQRIVDKCRDDSIEFINWKNDTLDPSLENLNYCVEISKTLFEGITKDNFDIEKFIDVTNKIWNINSEFNSCKASLENDFTKYNGNGAKSSFKDYSDFINECNSFIQDFTSNLKYFISRSKIVEPYLNAGELLELLIYRNVNGDDDYINERLNDKSIETISKYDKAFYLTRPLVNDKSIFKRYIDRTNGRGWNEDKFAINGHSVDNRVVYSAFSDLIISQCREIDTADDRFVNLCNLFFNDRSYRLDIIASTIEYDWIENSNKINSNDLDYREEQLKAICIMFNFIVNTCGEILSIKNGEPTQISFDPLDVSKYILGGRGVVTNLLSTGQEYIINIDLEKSENSLFNAEPITTEYVDGNGFINPTSKYSTVSGCKDVKIYVGKQSFMGIDCFVGYKTKIDSNGVLKYEYGSSIDDYFDDIRSKIFENIDSKHVPFYGYTTKPNLEKLIGVMFKDIGEWTIAFPCEIDKENTYPRIPKINSTGILFSNIFSDILRRK